MRTLTTLAIILFLGTAFGQDQEVTLNISKWAADVGALAAVIAGVLGFVRRKVWKGLDGMMVNIAAIVLGLVAGGGLSMAGYFDTILGGLSHGLQAGLASFIGVDGVRQILGRSSSGTLPR